MKKMGRVVSSNGTTVSVAVEGNAAADAAPCCTIPSVVLEAQNPTGTPCQPGDLVELSDGLGLMALGTSGFLAFPALLFGLGTAVLNQWWVGLFGIVVGVALAIAAFKSLKLNQFPLVLRTLGEPGNESMEEEHL